VAWAASVTAAEWAAACNRTVHCRNVGAVCGGGWACWTGGPCLRLLLFDPSGAKVVGGLKRRFCNSSNTWLAGRSVSNFPPAGTGLAAPGTRDGAALFHTGAGRVSTAPAAQGVRRLRLRLRTLPLPRWLSVASAGGGVWRLPALTILALPLRCACRTDLTCWQALNADLLTFQQASSFTAKAAPARLLSLHHRVPAASLPA